MVTYFVAFGGSLPYQLAEFCNSPFLQLNYLEHNQNKHAKTQRNKNKTKSKFLMRDAQYYQKYIDDVIIVLHMNTDIKGHRALEYSSNSVMGSLIKH